MNHFLRYPANGPTVPDLSPQVRAYGPRWSPAKKTGPIGEQPLMGFAWAGFWTGPMEHIEQKTDTKDERASCQ